MNYLIPYLLYGEIMENCWCKHGRKMKARRKINEESFCNFWLFIQHIQAFAAHEEYQKRDYYKSLSIVYLRRKLASVCWEIETLSKHWICSFAVINFNNSILLIQVIARGNHLFSIISGVCLCCGKASCFDQCFTLLRHKFQLVTNARAAKNNKNYW